MGAILDKYINQLQSWLGYNEADGTDDIIIKTYNSQRPSGSYKMSMDDPWCHATISAAAYKVGISGTIIPNTCYCPDGIDWFKSKGQWVGRNSSKYNPIRGDIIYYDWGGDGESDHVGATVSKDGNTLQVLEGNKSDKCCYRYIDQYDSCIMGYGRPDYDGNGGNTGSTKEDRNWLQEGDSGNDVLEMQKKLKAIGYSIDVDGEWGPATTKVVKQFQKDNDLNVDGGFGELSSARLNVLYNNKQTTVTPTTDYIGKYVKEFESGNAGPTSIEHCGDDGGLSYGTYQFIWSYDNEPGSAQRFWDKYYANTYGKATSYADLKNKWLKAVKADKKTFIDNEWEYVLDGGEYYSQMISTLKGYFNPNTFSRAMQDCCWSWSVHRGGYGAATEFKKACAAAGIDDPQKAKEKDLLAACYDYRWKHITYNGKRLTRYSPDGGEDSEYVTIQTKIGLKPIDYITPSGKLIKKVTTGNNTSTDKPSSPDAKKESTTDLEAWQKKWLMSVQKIVGVKATGIYNKDILHYITILDTGSKGSLVKKLQEKLIHLQYTEDPITGTYDSNTKKLVKEYQKWHSITANGVCNIETWEQLLSKRKGIK